jgi:hypothetical protein
MAMPRRHRPTASKSTEHLLNVPDESTRAAALPIHPALSAIVRILARQIVADGVVVPHVGEALAPFPDPSSDRID